MDWWKKLYTIFKNYVDKTRTVVIYRISFCWKKWSGKKNKL